MDSTMQDVPLTITTIMRYACELHGDRTVTTATGDGYRHTTYREIGEQAGRLANALRRLGIDGDQRVATFMWNNAEHLAAYLAIPSMGAVLHTLNIRLSPEQIAFIANEAEDQVIIANLSLVGQLARVLPLLETVHTVIAVGEGDIDALTESGKTVLRYDDVLAAESPEFDWPEIDERSAAAMCYTSGTTGNPKGVVYSHRSSYLHAMMTNTANAVGLDYTDKVLPIVPMFHANAWGMPYGAMMAGAKMVMTDRFLDSKSLIDLIETQRPTVAAAVPTIWNDVMHCLETVPGHDISSLRLVTCGGSAVPTIDDEGIREGVRCSDRAGVGHDRDLAAGDAGVAAAGCRRRPALGATRHAGPAGLRGGGAHSRRGRQPATARRRGGRRGAGAWPVDHRRVLPPPR